jgi:hypothetical protein
MVALVGGVVLGPDLTESFYFVDLAGADWPVLETLGIVEV